MCYQHVLVDQGGASQVLVAKAALLQARARQICDELDEQWWARVREAQLKQQDHWEAHSSDEPGKKQYWFNWVTGERRNSKPEGHQMNGSRHERRERQQYDRDLATAFSNSEIHNGADAYGAGPSGAP